MVIKTTALALLGSLLVVPASHGQPEKHQAVTWEKIKATGPALQSIGFLATRSSREIRSSPWSVGCETLDRDYARFSSYKDYVGELGVKHARLQSGWAACEKDKGVYHFEWLDACVRGLAGQGVEPWISLSYGNPIYKSELDLGAGVFTDEETMAAWCRYVEATVARYKDVVTEWEVWNEPKHSESPAAYANLLIRSIESIKKVQPNATILGFTVHGFAPGEVLKFPRAVFEILKAKNQADIVDYVTYHPYTPNPDACYPMVDGLAELARSYNPRIRIYQGESGCPSILEWGHAMNNLPWTETSQAKWDLRRMAGDRARGIRSSIFTMVDLRYPSMLQSFGLLRANLAHEVIYKRPSFHGVQHLAGFFDDSVEPAGLLAHAATGPRTMAVAGFRKQGSSVLLVWYDDRIPSDDLHWDLVDLTVEQAHFKDPVYVEMISGKVCEIAKANWHDTLAGVAFANLPVWDSPVMIAERSQVPLAPAAGR